MEIKIEAANIKSIDKLYKIEEQCFDEEAFSKQQITYLLGDYNTIALQAKVNSEIAGFIIAQIELEDDMLFGHIVTLNITPLCRRKGIAKLLLTEIESLFRQRSISECRLEVREDNHAALRLYQSLGYQRVGKLEKYYGKSNGLYLRKLLLITPSPK